MVFVKSKPTLRYLCLQLTHAETRCTRRGIGGINWVATAPLEIGGCCCHAAACGPYLMPRMVVGTLALVLERHAELPHIWPSWPVSPLHTAGKVPGK